MEIFNLLANIATAFGVILAVYQLKVARTQNVVEFEDSLNKEYRELLKELPTDVVLGGDISKEEIVKNINIFYRYIDLTNEQIYLRMRGRITESTWRSWEEGIRINFSIFGFEAAWKHIRKYDENRFNELHKLLSDKSPSDPKKWNHCSILTGKRPNK